MESRSESDDQGRFGELFGRTKAMRALFDESRQLARTERTLAIWGDPGTGKRALARAIHRESARASAPLVVVDAATLPVERLERELFGHGGAPEQAGALTLARGGTLLLEHADELPLPLQPRLLAALSSPQGGGRPHVTHLRVISISGRALSLECQRGKLQRELYAVLADRELTIPPLRERRDDIPGLAQHLLARHEEGRAVSLTPDAIELLSLHDWPGNVRELRNVVERFLQALRAGDAGARRFATLVVSGDLPAVERRTPAAGEPNIFEPGTSYREERARFEADFEQRYVAWLLDRHDGNISAAARGAEMDRKYLDKLARKHGLKHGR